jgi:hypothetical protein
MGLLDDLKGKGNQLAGKVNEAVNQSGGSGPPSGAAARASGDLFHDLGVLTWLDTQGLADDAAEAERERVMAALADAAAQAGGLQPALRTAAPPPPGGAPPPPGSGPPPPGAGSQSPPPPGDVAAPPPPGAGAAAPPAPSGPPAEAAPPPAPNPVAPPPPPAGFGDG